LIDRFLVPIANHATTDLYAWRNCTQPRRLAVDDMHEDRAMTALPVTIAETPFRVMDDPADWPGEIREIPLDQIRIDPENSPRMAVSRSRVREFAQIMRDRGPEAFPPVVVGGPEQDGRFPLGDGRHRMEAAPLAGAAAIRAVILPWATPRDLFAIAVQLSARVPKAFTNREKRRLVFRLLEDFPELSLRALADLSGTSHEFVAQRKRDRERGLTSGARPRAPRSPVYHAGRLLASFDALGDSIQKAEDLRRVRQMLANAARERYAEADPARELDVLAEWARSTAALLREAPPQLRVA
jgi:hypothetical protein